jgi:hypothetical protein
MLRYHKLEHRFVQYIPDALEPGVLYISMEYATAAHSCCCGCGLQVITPFAPTDWKLTFDGETISLWPSIGNWNFPCRSHYIIRQSRIITVEPWQEKQSEGGSKREKIRKEADEEQKFRYAEHNVIRPKEHESGGAALWDKLKKRIRRKRK